MSTPSVRPDPVRKFRRAVRYKIVLPVVLTAAGLLAFALLLIVGVATGSLESKQVAIIMGVVLTTLITFPLALLCLLPYALLVLGVIGMGRLHTLSARPMRAVRTTTTRIMHKTDETAPKVAAPFVAFNLRVTRWEQTLRGLRSAESPEPPALPPEQ